VPQVLVIDDEPNVREIVQAYLEREGFEVQTASTGTTGLQFITELEPQLIVLDVMLPGIDGIEILKRIRPLNRTPVLLLTARGEEFDRVLGLELGADDYLTKPFSPRELVARVKAILRRTGFENPSEIVRHGDLQLDPSTRQVHIAGVEILLSALEFDLLRVLLVQPMRVFSRNELIHAVWGGDFPGVDRVVDVHISSLRRKLGDDAERPRYLSTVRGVGYRMLEARA
jgi:DNA-binding response OmpR family regulator